MPETRQRMTSKAFGESFLRCVEEIRLKIDSLPQEQQPELRAALDRARRQHNQMQHDCAAIRQMVGDVRPTKAHVKLDRRASSRSQAF